MDLDRIGEPLALRLPSTVQAPGAARAFVREQLPTTAFDGVGDTVELLTSELVANVVKHVGLPMTVRVVRDATTVRVEVDDDSTDTPTLIHPGVTECGRGIFFVDALAAQWGTRSRDRGKTVWFVVQTHAEND